MRVQEPPPVPPVPQVPGSELSVSGTLEDVAAIVLLLGVGLILAAMLWPLIRAIAKRIEGGSPGAEMQGELDTLRERVQQLEAMQPRMAELEERVDFAERLLTRGQEAPSAGARSDQP
jgi:Tfp pilus assembly protein PilO